MTRKLVSPIVVVIVGGISTLLVAAMTSMSLADAAQLSGIAVGVTMLGLAAGALVLRALHKQTLGNQIAALSLTTTASLLAGAYAAAHAMFLSSHDLSVLVVVLLAAGTVGVASALVLGTRIEAASSSLLDAARRIGEAPGPTPDVAPRPASLELARLADELQVTRERLDEARQRERALEGSRRDLVAWVSHDLRTPLAGMRAIVEALEDGIVDEPATIARYCHTLGDEVERLSGLVDDLFELSRTQAGVLRLQFQQISLGDLVSDALAGSAPIAAAKGVHLQGRVVGPPPELMVSAPEMLRALRNVLENAIRHTPSDGSVMVEAGVVDAQPEHIYVEVRDTGGGVADEDLTRIFDVAFQSDPARSPGSGSGLGLAIAKGFVEAHQGELTVVNDNGGACFTLRLPRVPS